MKNDCTSDDQQVAGWQPVVVDIFTVLPILFHKIERLRDIKTEWLEVIKHNPRGADCYAVVILSTYLPIY